jgi:Protein of unknown function (DUF1566)
MSKVVAAVVAAVVAMAASSGCRSRDSSSQALNSNSTRTVQDYINDHINRKYVAYNATDRPRICKQSGASADPAWSQVMQDYYCTIPGDSRDPSVDIRACFTISAGGCSAQIPTPKDLNRVKACYAKAEYDCKHLLDGLGENEMFHAVMVDRNDGVVSSGNNGGGNKGGGQTIAGWDDVTTSNGRDPSTCAGTNGAVNCSFKDKVSGLSWSKQQPDSNWQTAIDTCATTLNSMTYAGNSARGFNGQTGWRLPTVEELKDASTHGIKATQQANFVANFHQIFWSGSSVSSSTSSAWIVLLASGYSNYSNKISSNLVVCVR